MQELRELFTNMELYQFILLVVIVGVIGIYKVIQKIFQHRQIIKAIKHGVDLSDLNFGKSPKHIKSFYLAAFFVVMSIPCILLLIHSIQEEFAENVIKILFITAVIVAAAVLFLVRGILLRRDRIKQMALKNGVPFNSLYSVNSLRFKGILSLAVGFPIAVVFTGFAIVGLSEQAQLIQKPFMIIIAIMLVGQILFLRGFMVRRAAKKQLRENQLKISTQQAAQPQPATD